MDIRERLDDGWTWPLVCDLQRGVEQLPPQRGQEQEVCGPLVLGLPKEDRRDQDDDDEHEPGAQCGDLEHEIVQKRGAPGCEPLKHLFIEWLRDAILDGFGDARENAQGDGGHHHSNGDEGRERCKEPAQVAGHEPEHRIEHERQAVAGYMPRNEHT